MLNHTALWVVIPNWNGADFIMDCLGSLEKQSQKHAVVVVDNGSVDSSVALIEENYPDITLLKQSKNLGFAGGVNAGITYAINAGAKYIALFNNDAVADSNWLKHLAESADADPSVGIVTGKLLKSDRSTFDSTGEFYSVWGVPFPRDRNKTDKGQRDKAEYVFAATGGQVFIGPEPSNRLVYLMRNFLPTTRTLT